MSAGGLADRVAKGSFEPMMRQLAIMFGAFAGGALLASAFGAANLGTALGVGQLCFAAALAWALLA